MSCGATVVMWARQWSPCGAAGSAGALPEPSQLACAAATVTKPPSPSKLQPWKNDNTNASEISAASTLRHARFDRRIEELVAIRAKVAPIGCYHKAGTRANGIASRGLP